MGAGLAGPADQAGSPKCNAQLQRIMIPLGILYCPTRRPAICYPYMALCDGSVQMMNYSINATVHAHLGNRKDGQAIDGKSF